MQPDYNSYLCMSSEPCNDCWL